MTLTQRVRRYNMNDIPPGATPTRRAIGAQWSGITLPQGGTTAIGPVTARDPGPSAFGVMPPTARDPGPSQGPGIGPQIARDPGPDDCCTNLRSYAQGEFRKIKQSMDSITDSDLSWKDIAGLSHSDPPQIVNIIDFGAKGDGTTDNQAAIQAAIDFLNTKFGQGVVLVPNGNFKVNTPITVKGGVVLEGMGRAGSVIQSLAADSKVVIYDATCLYAGARHISFLGFNNTAATQDCVTTTAGGVNLVFYDCIMQLGKYGLQMGANDSSVQDCYIYGAATTGGCVASTGANNYLRCKLDPPASIAFGFNHANSTAATLENLLMATDLSATGGFGTEALHIDDGLHNSAITKVVGVIFNGPINLLSSRTTMFTACEFGNTTFNANNGSVVVAACNQAFAATVIGLAGGASKILAANQNLT